MINEFSNLLKEAEAEPLLQLGAYHSRRTTSRTQLMRENEINKENLVPNSVEEFEKREKIAGLEEG